MGMDVYGKNADAERGKYFRNSIWSWRPLALYINEVAPEIAANCKYWHTNDFDGLNAEHSLALAAVLREELKSGRTVAYQIRYEAWQDSRPSEKCELCDGTGVRTDAIGVSAKQPDMIIPASEKDHGNAGAYLTFKPDHPRKGQKGWCNGCDGRGHKRPRETHYPFAAENVERFASFLEHCGGFEIR